MRPTSAPLQYEDELRAILVARDWVALREFTHRHNEIPGDVYDQPAHFWEVLLHKLTMNRIDLVSLHADSQIWLTSHSYTSDLGGY